MLSLSRKKHIHKSGKRKTAIAKATLKPGSGKIRINSKMLNLYEPEMYRLKIMEALQLAGDVVNKVNINVNIKGGGITSQAEAARLAIAKALVDYTKSEKLKDQFLKYDRNLLVADVRRKETHKPNTHGKARSKVQKSYR